MKKRKIYLTALLVIYLSIIWSCGGGGGGSGTPGASGTKKVGASISVTGATHSDPAGETGTSFYFDLSVTVCDPGPPPQYEDWGDDYAEIEFTAQSYDPNAPSGTLFIQRYVVEYIPPPFELDLPPITKQDLTITVTIPPDSSAKWSFIILDAGAKFKYDSDLINGLYNPVSSHPWQYDMKITFFGQDEFGNNFSFPWHQTVSIGYYDQC